MAQLEGNESKHLVIGQKEGYLKREMTIKRKKYILVGTISNSTLTFLPLQLNSLRFLEFRGSLLTILATVSYVTTSCVTTWLHVTHLLHITAQHIRSSLAAFGSPGFERPVSPPSTIALSSATERGLIACTGMVLPEDRRRSLHRHGPGTKLNLDNCASTSKATLAVVV